MELISSIAALASLLETCSFRQFWKTVRRRCAPSKVYGGVQTLLRPPQLEPLRDELLKDIPGFEAAVRKFVCSTMRITCGGPESAQTHLATTRAILCKRSYQAIPLAHLQESLALQGEDLTAARRGMRGPALLRPPCSLSCGGPWCGRERHRYK